MALNPKNFVSQSNCILFYNLKCQILSQHLLQYLCKHHLFLCIPWNCLYPYNTTLLFHYIEVSRNHTKTYTLTLFRRGFFWDARGWEGSKKSKPPLPPTPKICHTYPTMMELGIVITYLRRIQKIYESRDTHLEYCWYQHFFTGNWQIFLYQ